MGVMVSNGRRARSLLLWVTSAGAAAYEMREVEFDVKGCGFVRRCGGFIELTRSTCAYFSSAYEISELLLATNFGEWLRNVAAS